MVLGEGVHVEVQPLGRPVDHLFLFFNFFDFEFELELELELEVYLWLLYYSNSKIKRFYFGSDLME